MKGTYVLLIKLSNSCEILIGNLGPLSFKKGYYAYVGSALNNLDARIGHHLKIKKKQHWHIDYLLNKANVENVFFKEGEEREECEFAYELNKHFQSIDKFGSSDCNCKSHLFYSEDHSELRSAIMRLGTSEYEYKPNSHV